MHTNIRKDEEEDDEKKIFGRNSNEDQLLHGRSHTKQNEQNRTKWNRAFWMNLTTFEEVRVMWKLV